MKRSKQCKWMGLLLLAALLLCGCGGQAEVIDNVVPTSQVIEIRPDPSATPMPVVTPAPTQTLIPVTTPAPTTVPTAAPTSLPVVTTAPTTAPKPTAAPTPRPTSAPAPAPVNTAPRVTKSPTDETVAVGGSCYFVAKYENAIWAEWHFVSPDGSRDLGYEDAGREFAGLEILNGYASTMKLKNIPAGLNGWSVYCRFSNNVGATNTEKAKITVKGAPAPTPGPEPTDTPAIIIIEEFDYTGSFTETAEQKASMMITGNSSKYQVTVRWTVSDEEYIIWTFSGRFSATGILEYSDAVKTVVNTTTGVSEIQYTAGTGKLAYVDSGVVGVYWTEDSSGTTSFFSKN